MVDVVNVSDRHILFQGASWTEEPIAVNLSNVGSFQLYMSWFSMKRPGGAALSVNDLVEVNKIVAGVHGQNGIVPSKGKRVDGGRLVLFDEVVKNSGGFLKLEVDGLLSLVGVPCFELTVVGPEVLEDESGLLVSWWFLREADWAAL